VKQDDATVTPNWASMGTASVRYRGDSYNDGSLVYVGNNTGVHDFQPALYMSATSVVNQ
jgi:hypothetical protein